MTRRLGPSKAAEALEGRVREAWEGRKREGGGGGWGIGG